MPTPGPTRSIDTMMLPTQGSQLLLQVVGSMGVKPSQVLRGSGLQVADLEDDATWVSYRQTMRIVDNAYQLTEQPDLGLRVGASEDLSTFGILGYAMLSCETLGASLAVGEKYQNTAQNLCDVKMDKDEACFYLRAATPFVLKPRQYRFTIEELFAGVINLIRALTGEKLYARRIECAYDDPGYGDQYEKLFECEIAFNCAENRLVLDRKVIDLPVLQANKFNARMSEKLCQDILRKYSDEEDLATRIRHIILREPGIFPDEAAVADALAVSGRTLRRQLSDIGTSYRELLDQVRSDLAQQYLQNSSLNLDQVAQLLGYTETTNFRRAFKRWLGMSPRDFRKLPH